MRRVKLNQEIQIANFRAMLAFDGEEISLAQALELRKTLLAERAELAQRIDDRAGCRWRCPMTRRTRGWVHLQAEIALMLPTHPRRLA